MFFCSFIAFIYFVTVVNVFKIVDRTILFLRQVGTKLLKTVAFQDGLWTLLGLKLVSGGVYSFNKVSLI